MGRSRITRTGTTMDRATGSVGQQPGCRTTERARDWARSAQDQSGGDDPRCARELVLHLNHTWSPCGCHGGGVGWGPWILPGGWDSWCGVPGRGWLCGPAQGISPATRPGSWSRCLTSCRGACDEDNPASPDRGVPVLCSCARPRTGESASAGRRRSWGGRARRFAVPRHRPAVHHGSERHRPAANH